MKTLILGLGNVLLGDEGFGVHVVRKYRERGHSPEVLALDVGTAILDALPALEEAEWVIVVDAIQADADPGTVFRMPYDDFARSLCLASLHGFDLSRVMALTRRAFPPEVLVIGAQPGHIGWSMELTEPLQAAVDEVIDLIQLEIDTERFLQQPESEEPPVCLELFDGVADECLAAVH